MAKKLDLGDFWTGQEHCAGVCEKRDLVQLALGYVVGEKIRESALKRTPRNGGLNAGELLIPYGLSNIRQAIEARRGNEKEMEKARARLRSLNNEIDGDNIRQALGVLDSVSG